MKSEFINRKPLKKTRLKVIPQYAKFYYILDNNTMKF